MKFCHQSRQSTLSFKPTGEHATPVLTRCAYISNVKSYAYHPSPPLYDYMSDHDGTLTNPSLQTSSGRSYDILDFSAAKSVSYVESPYQYDIIGLIWNDSVNHPATAGRVCLCVCVCKPCIQGFSLDSPRLSLTIRDLSITSDFDSRGAMIPLVCIAQRRPHHRNVISGEDALLTYMQ